MINDTLIDLIKSASKDVIQLAKNRSRQPRILSLGYPSILLPSKSANAQLLARRNSINSLEQSMLDYAAQVSIDVDCFTYESLFNDCGFSPDTPIHILDISSAQNPTIVWDLNYPIPRQWHRQYDLIVDSGTFEHCFNIGTALLNVTSMLSQGGVLVTAMPFFSPQHGYYSISPCLLDEFFTPLNGFRLNRHFTFSYSTFGKALEDEGLILYDESTPRIALKKLNPPHPVNTIYASALKISDLCPSFPLQAKYR